MTLITRDCAQKPVTNKHKNDGNHFLSRLDLNQRKAKVCIPTPPCQTRPPDSSLIPLPQYTETNDLWDKQYITTKRTEKRKTLFD